MNWIGQNALFSLRTQLFRRIQSLDVSFFDNNPIGRLVTRVTNDIDTISEVLSGGFIMIVVDSILIVSIIGFMFFLNVELTLISLSVVPFLFIVTYIFRNKVRKIFREIRKSVARINSFLNEYLNGIFTIKLFNRESLFQQKFQEINTENKNLWIRTINYYAVFFPTIEFLSAVALGLIIWFTAGNILSGLMTIGTFFAFIQYAEMFFRPIRDLTEKFTNLQNAMASSERIFYLLEQKPEIKLPINPVQFTTLRKAIEFRNVSFSYDGKKEVLSNVSFKVNKGETVAIVGPTGSGKTTIINLLCRFYDVTSGEILIDDVNIKDYSIESFRKRTSLVSQDVFLFSRTIYDNISMGEETLHFEQIISSSKNIGSINFISSLPEKFETNVFEKGITLSAGQRQLISFTRAIARNPDILILDEATSNIDSEMEKLIEESIAKLLEGRTSIVIAHRFSTIQRANRIIVLHKGEIKEMGSHNELLEKNGIYAKLYRLQFRNNYQTIHSDI
jgi:ABC-type multidrug transport system fused ATPase/permease subunit